MSVSALVRAVATAAGALFMLFRSAPSLAGGTPENVALIIDPTDPTSMYVGNYYKNARKIPDSNVLYMRSAAASYNAFAMTSQAGLLGTLAQRNLLDHIDYVVLAPLNAYSVSFGLFNSGFKTISLAAAYEIVPLSNEPAMGSLQNPYGASAASIDPSGNPPLAFHSRQAYLNGAPSTDPSAGNMYIGAMLGYTQGPVGNSVSQLLAMIDRSVAADGTRPAGTFYFESNQSDAPRNVRACGSTTACPSPTNYTRTAGKITGNGGSATVASNGIVPAPGTTSIMGIMTGFANYDIATAGLTLVPGAFADHLTSFAGVLDGTGNQTTVESWIAAGASGSAGSVEEPFAVAAKFPSADLHYYYYRGMSLGESYLRSVEALPLEMLFYGDPLTRPFAYLPSVSVTSPNSPQSGVVTITPVASTASPGAAIGSFTLLIDGANMGSVAPGQTFSLDTSLLDDGRHDLRVLAYDNTPVQSVGRWVGVLDTSNYGRAATLAVSSASGTLAQPFTFSYSATGGQVLEAHLVQNGRVLASSTSSSDALTIYGQNLGEGISTVHLEVVYGDGRRARSVPVTVNVSPSGIPAPGVVPVAFGYSRHLTSQTAYVLELPAAYNTAPGSVTFTVLNSPSLSTVIQPTTGSPYIIVQPVPGASGSEQLFFQLTSANGTSNTAALTLVYTGA